MSHYHALATCGQDKYLVIRQFREQRNTALPSGESITWGLAMSSVTKAELGFPAKFSVLLHSLHPNKSRAKWIFDTQKVLKYSHRFSFTNFLQKPSYEWAITHWAFAKRQTNINIFPPFGAKSTNSWHQSHFTPVTCLVEDTASVQWLWEAARLSPWREPRELLGTAGLWMPWGDVLGGWNLNFARLRGSFGCELHTRRASKQTREKLNISSNIST